MKALFASLCLLILGLYQEEAAAQIPSEDSAFLAQVFEETPFIFEGEVVYKEVWEDPQRIYTTVFIEIQSIFRGHDSLECGLVEWTFPGGRLPSGEMTEYSHGFRVGLGSRGIFFGMKSAFPTSGLTILTDHKFTLMTSVNTRNGMVLFMPEDWWDIGPQSVGLYQSFDTLADAYQLVENQSNITRYDCPQTIKESDILFNKAQDKQLDIALAPNKNHVKVEVHIKKRGRIQLEAIDQHGVGVSQLCSNKLKAGKHEREYDLGHLPIGLYIIKVTAGDAVETKKVFVKH